MGLITKQLKVMGDRGEREVNVLFDAGSSETLMREDVAESLATISKLPHPVHFKMADGTPLEANKVVNFFITINGYELVERAIVVGKLTDEMVIGVEMMQTRKIKLDLEQEKITIDPKAARLRV